MPGSVFVNPIYAQAPPCNTKEEEFIDHYAIFGLDFSAIFGLNFSEKSAKIKEAHRKLREVYFSTDVNKYKALQAAYAVLMDKEARREYDVIYCQRVGLPLPSPACKQPVVPPPPAPCAEPVLAPSESALPTPKSPAVVEVNEEEVRAKELAEKRKRDPNYALKRYQPVRKPVGGLPPSMRPSHVPILNGYKKRTHSRLSSARPPH